MKKILIILLFPICVNAQTRFFISQITPQVSPAVNAGWNVTTGNAVWEMNTYADRSANVNAVSGASGAAAVRKMIWRQIVSFPLAPQTLNGTLTGQLRMVEGSPGSVTGQGFVYFRIVNPDGTIANEVGTLTTTNLTGTNTNRTLIALTLSSVSITAGQRFCLDIGFNYSVGTLTTNTGTCSFTGVGTDLPVDNTTTTGGRSWIEFSQSILFQNADKGFF